MISIEQIQALKAAAIAVGRDRRTDDEWFHYLQCVHHKAILSLLEAWEADKALIEVYREAYAEAQHMVWVNWEAAASMNVENEERKRRIDELESQLETSTLTVKLPDYSEFAIVHFTSCSDDYAKGWVDGRNTVNKAYSTACAAAGITLVVGE